MPPGSKTGKATGPDGRDEDAADAALAPGRRALTQQLGGQPGGSAPALSPGKRSPTQFLAPQILPPSARRMPAALAAVPSAPQGAPGSRKDDPKPRASVIGYRDADKARKNLANPTWDPNASYDGRKP